MEPWKSELWKPGKTYMNSLTAALAFSMIIDIDRVLK